MDITAVQTASPVKYSVVNVVISTVQRCGIPLVNTADTTALDSKTEEMQSEIHVVTELIRQCIEENANTGLDQTEYQKRYYGFVTRYEKAKEKLEKIEEQRQEHRVKRERLDAFLNTLVRQDAILTEFDETLWYAVIDKVTGYDDDNVQFAFRDGTVIKG